jgi:hypothetical protein
VDDTRVLVGHWNSIIRLYSVQEKVITGILWELDATQQGALGELQYSPFGDKFIFSQEHYLSVGFLDKGGIESKFDTKYRCTAIKFISPNEFIFCEMYMRLYVYSFSEKRIIHEIDSWFGTIFDWEICSSGKFLITLWSWQLNHL